jgi:hypothetical protein
VSDAGDVKASGRRSKERASASSKTPRSRSAAARPPGLMCEGCARRALGLTSLAEASNAGPLEQHAESQQLQIFQLKLRDWLNVPRVEYRPCLSVCPEQGVTVERRGKTMVLDQSAIEAVRNQFDPTRQLGFNFDDES